MQINHHRMPMMLIALGFLASCVNPQDIVEIKKNQKDILAKLDKVGKGAARPTPPSRPKGPDPKKVYAFPADTSPAKGPKDALVTLIEISDFQ
jgi:hypothetical protein